VAQLREGYVNTCRRIVVRQAANEAASNFNSYCLHVKLF